MKFKQFLRDASDLNSLQKSPNDFPFWYFILLHCYLTFPLLLAFLLGYFFKKL